MATKLKVINGEASESGDKVFGLKLVQQGDGVVRLVLTDEKGVKLERGVLLAFAAGEVVMLHPSVTDDCPFPLDEDGFLLTRR